MNCTEYVYAMRAPVYVVEMCTVARRAESAKNWKTVFPSLSGPENQSHINCRNGEKKGGEAESFVGLSCESLAPFLGNKRVLGQG